MATRIRKKKRKRGPYKNKPVRRLRLRGIGHSSSGGAGSGGSGSAGPSGTMVGDGVGSAPPDYTGPAGTKGKGKGGKKDKKVVAHGTKGRWKGAAVITTTTTTTTTTTVAAPSEPSGTPWAWWDLSQETGYNDGEDVQPILDFSANSHILEYGTVPYKTNVQNGLAGLRLTGAHYKRQLSGVMPTQLQPNTYFIVAKKSANGKYLFSGDGGLDNAVFTDNVSNLWAMRSGLLVYSDEVADENWHILTATFNSPNSYLRLDGVPILGPVDCGSAGMRGMWLGSDGFGNSGLVGDIGEMLFYNGIEDPADNEAYLANKWDITLATP